MTWHDFLAPTIIERYIVGSVAPFVATGLTFLPEVEGWLKILTLLTGIIISILSFASAESEKRRRRKLEEQQKEK
jgi:hypothetical protein